jgi:hypothetical protein
VATLYAVRASVVDIRTDSPTSDDAFLVDSNVWFWQTYTKASLTAKDYQAAAYPGYLKKALGVQSRLLRCGLSMAELASAIEDVEYRTYISTPGNAACNRKEFRHNCFQERAVVESEVGAAWAQVKNMAEPIDITIDEGMTEASVSRLGQEAVGGYDLFLSELLLTSGVCQIITDDGDFATVPGIWVFTANGNVIRSAGMHNQLVVRQARTPLG